MTVIPKCFLHSHTLLQLAKGEQHLFYAYLSNIPLKEIHNETNESGEETLGRISNK
jgi:hypothetical protein